MGSHVLGSRDFSRDTTVAVPDKEMVVDAVGMERTWTREKGQC